MVPSQQTFRLLRGKYKSAFCIGDTTIKNSCLAAPPFHVLWPNKCSDKYGMDAPSDSKTTLQSLMNSKLYSQNDLSVPLLEPIHQDNAHDTFSPKRVSVSISVQTVQF